MSQSFNNLKKVSFNSLDIKKINREKIAKELFLTTFSRDAYSSSENLSLSEITKDNILDDFIHSLENLLSEMTNNEITHQQDNLFDEYFKKIVFKSFLNDDFDLLKSKTAHTEETINLY